MADPTALLTALQAALDAENAAIYGYGVAGAFLRGGDRAYAAASLAVHVLVRDRLTALISAHHGQPTPAQPAYRLPAPVASARTARDLAAHLEQGVAGAHWDLVAATAAGSNLRALAIGWISDAAVREAHWGARQALPGQPT